MWCPKYRRKVLTNGIDARLKELLLDYPANISVDIMEMEIMPDHVHILMEVDPQFGIHKAVKSMKGYTSRILREEFIKQYIENQKTSQRQKDKQG